MYDVWALRMIYNSNTTQKNCEDLQPRDVVILQIAEKICLRHEKLMLETSLYFFLRAQKF
jgi:hypothetical protein